MATRPPEPEPTGPTEPTEPPGPAEPPRPTEPAPAEPPPRVGPGIDVKAAVSAGVIAGAVFLILEMVMVPLFAGGSPWGPPRMIGAIVLGQGVLPPPATFALGVVLVALIVHFVLSIVYALGLAWVVRAMAHGTAVLLGGAGGLVLYFVNFYLFTAVFPWFAQARNWIGIFAHIVFGLVAVWAYLRLRRPAPVV